MQLPRVSHSSGRRQGRRRAWRRSGWTISPPATSSSRSATRRSTTRTRSRRPAPARSCASIRWSAASTSPAKSCPRSDPAVQARAEGAGQRLRPVRDARRRLRRIRARARATGSCRFPPGLDEFQCMAIGTAGLHRGARDSSHGAERPAAGGRRDRRDRRDRRRRQPRDRHARAAAATRSSRVTGKQVCGRVSRSSSARARVLLRDAINLGSRPLEEAQWAGAIDNRRRRRARVADAHHEFLGQHRQHRPGRERRAEDDRRCRSSCAA